ncbi:hypothetical protein [Pelagicoccus albus]|uniref:Membrane-anchored ribosome-binding protein, inhibits growth in stationary phase, ElaB/YqjD/DUF883 family n=1 Tax=Pelagicoccus albus TaxID=415222 RepID=A0A7X1B9Z9_9BACT|nr:hypothetical protein [Pelagicoccus albus]MBC2607138.1 hypothetical protein [Pelagicoccus albus]
MTTQTNSGIDPAYENEAQTPSPLSSNEDWLSERKREVCEALEEKSKQLGNQAKSRLSERMSNFDTALNKASKSLEKNNEIPAAEATRQMADKIKGAVDYLDENSPEQLVKDSANTVKKQPLLTLGAALAAGFIVGRLLTANSGEDQA